MINDAQEPETPQKPSPKKGSAVETIVKFPLTSLAIRQYKWVYFLLITVILSGLVAYSSLPKEWSPDIKIPVLVITTPYPRSSPEDVEILVTNPLEKELKNVKNLKKITSDSAEGVSIVVLRFDIGIDITEAKDAAKEAIDKAKPDLPEDAEDTVINEINLSESPIMVLVISGEIETEDLTTLADDMADDIKAVAGVLDAKRVGGLDKEIQVNVDPKKLQYYNLSLTAVGNAISRENINLPLGSFDNGPMSVIVRTVGQITQPEDLEGIVVASRGNAPVYLRDVASIFFKEKDIASKSRLYGSPSVSVSVSKRAGENMQAIAQQVRDISQKYLEENPNIDIRVLEDQTVLVDANMSNLENNIYTGLLFVVLVLMFFMGFWNALIVGIVVPLSMLLTFITLKQLDINLNFIVLFGLILGLGMLVDNAIVIVENIYRHLQTGLSRREAAIVGVSEVAYPVIGSTLTTVAAFFPLIFFPGIIGEFISYMPKTILVALLSSLFVALVFSPVICSNLMRRPKKIVATEVDEIKVPDGRFYRAYIAFLRKCLKRWYFLVAAIVVSLIGLIWFYFGVIKAGIEFFPQDEPSAANIIISTPFGTNLEETDRITRLLEKIIEPYVPYTDSIVSYVGSSRGSSSNGGGSNSSYITLSFPTWEKQTEKPSKIIADIRNDLKKPENQIAGAEYIIDVASSGPPGSKALEIEVVGDDLEVLKGISNRIKGLIFDTPGLVNLSDDLDVSRSEIALIPDREKIIRAGLSLSDFSREIRAAVSGTKYSSFRIGKDDYDIVVRYLNNYRENLNDLENIVIYNQQGQSVQLSDLVLVRRQLSYGTISHVSSERTLSISGDVADGVPATTLVAGIKEKLAKEEWPKGYTVRFAGEEADRQEAQEFLLQAFVIAVALIFLILLWSFRSIIMSSVILLTIPLSIMGVFLGLILHQAPLVIVMSGIGFVSLAGVVVNNGIVLLDFIKYMSKKGYNLEDAVVYTAALRLRPVFLTAATTILGMIPMMFGMDINFYRLPNVVIFGAGSGAIWKPLSNAIAYGLMVSTFLTLVFVPTVYYNLARLKAYIFKVDLNSVHSSD